MRLTRLLASVVILAAIWLIWLSREPEPTWYGDEEPYRDPYLDELAGRLWVGDQPLRQRLFFGDYPASAWDTAQAKEDEEALAEERRLLYVAITRARTHLT